MGTDVTQNPSEFSNPAIILVLFLTMPQSFSFNMHSKVNKNIWKTVEKTLLSAALTRAF